MSRRFAATSGTSFRRRVRVSPTPEWGTLLVNARTYIRTAPYLINIPGGAIFFVVLAFNLLGNSLRDVLDPRL